MTAPLLAVADSSLLIRYTDATVLVIRSGKTTSGQIDKALAPFAQEKILGVVLNRVDKSDSYGGYYYGYGSQHEGDPKTKS